MTQTTSQERSPLQRPQRRWYQWLVLALAACVSVAAVGTAVILFQANRSANNLGRIDLSAVLDTGVLDTGEADSAARTILLMGFDSDSTLGPSDALGSVNFDAQREAKVIWLLRVDPADDALSVLSVPPQTALTLATPTSSATMKATTEVAAASIFSVAGAVGAIAAVETTLGVGIDHFGEMDLDAIDSLVDAVGGVPIYVPFPLQDAESGFEAATQGCMTFDGDTVRRYLQSDALVGLIDGEWVEMSAQAGQSAIDRERDLLTAMIRRLPLGFDQPLASYAFWRAAADAVTVDTSLSRGELMDLVAEVQGAQDRELLAFTVPLTASAPAAGESGTTAGDRLVPQPMLTGSELDGILAHFGSGEFDRADPRLTAARDRALQPGMTGLRSITCR